jgi:hypothetical protein
VGRFVSADSIVPEPGNPQAWNRYSYAYGNPLRYTDPTGHGIWDKVKEAAGDAVDWAVDKGKAVGRVASGLYDSARGGARNLIFDNRIDQSLPQVPFTNPAEAVLLSLMGEDKAYLGGDAIDLIRADPAMIAHEQDIVDRIKSDPRYMNESFNTEFIPERVGFGGKAAPYDKRIQAKDPLNPKYRDTWKVAANELTWLIRNASVTPTVYVSKDGSFIIDYHLTDTLDLRPNRPEGDMYNDVTRILVL